MHEPLARVRLEHDLIGAEPGQRRDGRPDPLLLVHEAVERSEAGARQQARLRRDLLLHGAPDRADAREVEVAGFLLESLEVLVDGQ